MPVTAKLSRKVYDRLGDDVVNAIVDWFNQVDSTYRADLREMNDLNFARFDAKMGERLAELDAKWERRFGEFETKLEHRLGGFETDVQHRLGTFEAMIAHRFGTFEAMIERRLGDFQGDVTRRIYGASAVTFLAQIAALVTLFKVFGTR
jgi:hypothetical protein